VIDAVDLHAVMYVALGGAIFGILASLGITETAPNKVGIPAVATARR